MCRAPAKIDVEGVLNMMMDIQPTYLMEHVNKGMMGAARTRRVGTLGFMKCYSRFLNTSPITMDSQLKGVHRLCLDYRTASHADIDAAQNALSLTTTTNNVTLAFSSPETAQLNQIPKQLSKCSQLERY